MCILFFLALISTLFFTLFFHPFFMSVSLLMLSISLVILLHSFSFYWMCYMVILVYIGGVMILFLYISSLLPNIYFRVNFFTLMMVLFIFCFTFNLFFFLKPLEKNYFSEEFIFISFIKSQEMFYFILSYLFFILILSVMFAKSDKNTLRNL